MQPKAPAGAPWLPAPWEDADAGAIQALARGDASEDQQRRALEWIINRACATYDMSFHPEGDRATCFAEGKRFVGNQIIKMMKINLAKMRSAHGGRADEQQ